MSEQAQDFGPPRYRALPKSDSAAHTYPGDQEQNVSQPEIVAGLLLRLYADALDQLEASRIAVENQLRDARSRDGMLTPHHDASLQGILDRLKAEEHGAALALTREMRKHPLGPWVKETKGVGERQAARLLASIGDPLIKPASYDEDNNLIEPERRRRGPAELWQYCGHGDPERSRRRKGQRVEYSPTAKMRVHLIAVACMKCMSSPYRKVYDAERLRWADRDTTDMHKHNHALRVVGKAILRDMWREAKFLADD